MPDTERSSTRLTVDRASFENHFVLEGAGRAIAADAIAAGIIHTPYEVVEMICRVNERFAGMLFDRMFEELEPLDKADDYAMATTLRDSKRSASIMFETLGKDRLTEIIPDISRQLREEAGGFRAEDLTDRPPGAGEPAILALDPFEFESFFNIESIGCLIAVEAFRQGVIGTPYEMVETVCAANRLHARKLCERLKVALAESDRRPDLESPMSRRALADLLITTFGEKGHDAMIGELALEVAEELHVSTTNRPARLYEKYKLWSAALAFEPN